MGLIGAIGRLETTVLAPLEELTDAAPLVADSSAGVCDTLAFFAQLADSTVAAGIAAAIISALGTSAVGYADGFAQTVDTPLSFPAFSASTVATVRTTLPSIAVGVATRTSQTETSFSALSTCPSAAVRTAVLVLARRNALWAVHWNNTRRISECFVGASVSGKILNPAAGRSSLYGRTIYRDEFSSLTHLCNEVVAAPVHADFGAVVINAVVLQTAHALSALTTRAAASILPAVLSIAGDEDAFSGIAERAASALATSSAAPIVAAVLAVTLRLAHACEIDALVVSEAHPTAFAATVVTTFLAETVGDAKAGVVHALAVPGAFSARLTASVVSAFLPSAIWLADFPARESHADFIVSA